MNLTINSRKGKTSVNVYMAGTVQNGAVATDFQPPKTEDFQSTARGDCINFKRLSCFVRRLQKVKPSGQCLCSVNRVHCVSGDRSYFGNHG